MVEEKQLKIEIPAWFRSQIENSGIYVFDISKHSVRKSRPGTCGASMRLRQYTKHGLDYYIKKKKLLIISRWFSQLTYV